MAKQPKKIKDVIEDHRAELIASGLTLSDAQLAAIVKLVKAAL